MVVAYADHDVVGALGHVFDPCSVGANAPLSIVDMGLLVDWQQEGRHLRVRLCVTSPCCTMAPSIARAAEEQLLRVAGIESVDVVIDPSVRWTPERISEQGRRLLSERREASIRRDQLTPQQWRTQSTKTPVAAVAIQEYTS